MGLLIGIAGIALATAVLFWLRPRQGVVHPLMRSEMAPGAVGIALICILVAAIGSAWTM
ncbi:MAG: hypothetical protein JNK11_04740 [Alphaproteobacteria bacterium]|nr:hypothetical protein [Alphaproteobacteria bacterium]